MVELLPLTGAQLVAPDRAAQVIPPPGEARDPAATAQAAPSSFLHALPPPGASPADLERCRSAVERLRRTGHFQALPDPCLLVLELVEGPSRIRAVVGDVEVASFLDGRIRPHEHVRPTRVRELTEELAAVGWVRSPVCVIHRRSVALDREVGAVTAAPPALDTPVAGGARLRAWVVADEPLLDRLPAAANAVADATVADGHHRVAATARRVGPSAGGGRGVGRVLTALVAHDELVVEPFHRRVDGVAGVTPDRVRWALAQRGLSAAALPGASAPPQVGAVHVAVGGQWLRVPLPTAGVGGPPDVEVVDRVVLPAVTELAAATERATVVTVPGPAGLAALERPDSVGLAIRPPSMAQLLATTAAGRVLPRKSTYLSPKLHAGLLLVPR